MLALASSVTAKVEGRAPASVKVSGVCGRSSAAWMGVSRSVIKGPPLEKGHYRRSSHRCDNSRFQRQVDAGDETSVGVIGQDQAAAMAFRCAPGNRQTQAVALGSLARRAVKRFAQLAEVFGFDAGAVVAHADQNALAVAPGVQLDRLTLWVEALGVAQQVIHGALD